MRRLRFQTRVVNWEAGLTIPLKVLAKLNVLNKGNGVGYEKHGGFKVPYNAFYVSELAEYVDIGVDYVKWVLDEPKVRCLFCHLLRRLLSNTVARNSRIR